MKKNSKLFLLPVIGLFLFVYVYAIPEVVEDNTPPEITLTVPEGDITVYAGDTRSNFKEPGFTAMDGETDLTDEVSVTGFPEIFTTDFTIYYDVKDAAGNAAEQQSRNIKVVKKIPFIHFGEEEVINVLNEPVPFRFKTNIPAYFAVKSLSQNFCTVEDEDGLEVTALADGKCTLEFSFPGNEYFEELETTTFDIFIVEDPETIAPNNGDFNNDGIPDIKQDNVKTVKNNGKFSSVENGEQGGYISNFNISKRETTQPGETVQYRVCPIERVVSVPTNNETNNVREVDECRTVSIKMPDTIVTNSVLSFELRNIPVGTTQEFKITTELEDGQTSIDPRKIVNGVLMNIPDATITYGTLDGKNIAKIVFSVKDGGPLDEDGLENGVILDPVVFVTTVSAPTTSGGGVVLPPMSVNSDATLFNNKPVVPVSTGTVLGTSTTALQNTFSTSTNAIFTRNLGYGSRGDDVKELQRILIAGGYLKLRTGLPTGWFGPLTRAALAKWQKENGIADTGFLGEESRAKLGN